MKLILLISRSVCHLVFNWITIVFFFLLVNKNALLYVYKKHDHVFLSDNLISSSGEWLWEDDWSISHTVSTISDEKLAN